MARAWWTKCAPCRRGAQNTTVSAPVSAIQRATAWNDSSPTGVSAWPSTEPSKR